MASGAPMMGATATFASGGGCAAGGGGTAAVSGAAGVFQLKSEALVSQPAKANAASDNRMAVAIGACRRCAAAASMVVTMTSPLLQSIPWIAGCRRTNPAAGDSTAGTSTDSLLADTSGVQFETGENSVHATCTEARTPQSCGKPTLSQDDGGDLASVFGLFSRLGAPIAEEMLGLGRSAGRDLHHGNSRARQAKGRVARQV